MSTLAIPNNLTVPEIRQLLRERGLNSKGNKQQLHNRLVQLYSTQGARRGSTNVQYHDKPHAQSADNGDEDGGDAPDDSMSDTSSLPDPDNSSTVSNTSATYHTNTNTHLQAKEQKYRLVLEKQSSNKQCSLVVTNTMPSAKVYDLLLSRAQNKFRFKAKKIYNFVTGVELLPTNVYDCIVDGCKLIVTDGKAVFQPPVVKVLSPTSSPVAKSRSSSPPIDNAVDSITLEDFNLDDSDKVDLYSNVEGISSRSSTHPSPQYSRNLLQSIETNSPLLRSFSISSPVLSVSADLHPAVLPFVGSQLSTLSTTSPLHRHVSTPLYDHRPISPNLLSTTSPMHTTPSHSLESSPHMTPSSSSVAALTSSIATSTFHPHSPTLPATNKHYEQLEKRLKKAEAECKALLKAEEKLTAENEALRVNQQHLTNVEAKAATLAHKLEQSQSEKQKLQREANKQKSRAESVSEQLRGVNEQLRAFEQLRDKFEAIKESHDLITGVAHGRSTATAATPVTDPTDNTPAPPTLTQAQMQWLLQVHSDGLQRVQQSITQSIEYERHRFLEQRSCKICYERTADTIILPCCHLYCTKCSLMCGSVCPSCRRSVTEKKQVYW